jgi:glutaredoxin
MGGRECDPEIAMRELCKTHGLVLAPDGKCILCRRPPGGPAFALSEEQESVVSRGVTVLLGACLAAAAGAIVYASQLPPGYSGERHSDRSQGPAQIDETEEPVREQPDAGRPEPNKVTLGALAPKPKLKPGDRVAKEPSGRPAYAGVEVTMYAAPWCYICDRTRDFLLARDVVLVEHDIDRDAKAVRQLAKVNPQKTLPTLEIGGRVYVGFNPWELEDALRAAATAQRSSATQPAR